MEIITILQADYQRFPVNQTYDIYDENVYFKDPLNEFRGIKRYQQMIRFLTTWFSNIQMELHNIEQVEDLIKTEWTLNMTCPLFWQPRLSIPGRSELRLNSEAKIISHIDYWHCGRLDVLKQIFR